MKSKKNKNFAIILAGGIGQRMNSKLPKQFMKIGKKPIIVYPLEEFERNGSINGIVVVVNENYKDFLLNLLKKYNFKKIKGIVRGGETRQESIFNALQYLKRINPDYVVIHESVRPFINQNLINKMLNEVVAYKAVSLGVNVKTSIIELDNNGFISKVPDKNNLYQAQSQTFGYDLIFKAHKAALKKKIYNAHDDNILLLSVNKNAKIKVVPGDYNLFKITTPEDITLAQDTLKRLIKES